jgi:AraC-like DNA-binding protein
MSLTNNAGVLNTLWKVIESYEQNPEPLFKQLGLDLKLAEDPNARLPYAKVERLWQEAITLLTDPNIGFKAAELWHPSSAGALSYAWLTSASLRDAFERLVRYIRVTTDAIECHTEESEHHFSFFHAFTSEATYIPELVDFHLATIMNLCRKNYGASLNPVTVNISRSAPKDSGTYFAFFRCPVHFDSPQDSLTFTKKVIDERLGSGNPMLAQLHDQFMIKYLANLDADNIIERIKSIIIEQLPSGNVTDNSVANALNMSRRTIHRRLQQEGTTFRVILNEVRGELADQYIQDSSLNLNEISYLLGFSEMSSFSRAFKRWKGAPPSSYR